MRIPSNAKRVFKSRLFEVYQWRQRLFDGSYATFERVRRPDTVQVFAEKDGKLVLLLEKHPGRRGVRPGLPGGRVDAGETPLHAARRELLEETGLASRAWKRLRVYDSRSPLISWRVHIYVARRCFKAAEPHVEAGERIEIRYATPERLIDAITAPRYDFFTEMVRTRNDMALLAGLKKELLE